MTWLLDQIRRSELLPETICCTNHCASNYAMDIHRKEEPARVPCISRRCQKAHWCSPKAGSGHLSMRENSRMFAFLVPVRGGGARTNATRACQSSEKLKPQTAIGDASLCETRGPLCA